MGFEESSCFIAAHNLHKFVYFSHIV